MHYLKSQAHAHPAVHVASQGPKQAFMPSNKLPKLLPGRCSAGLMNQPV